MHKLCKVAAGLLLLSLVAGSPNNCPCAYYHDPSDGFFQVVPKVYTSGEVATGNRNNMTTQLIEANRAFYPGIDTTGIASTSRMYIPCFSALASSGTAGKTSDYLNSLPMCSIVSSTTPSPAPPPPSTPAPTPTPSNPAATPSPPFTPAPAATASAIVACATGPGQKFVNDQCSLATQTRNVLTTPGPKDCWCPSFQRYDIQQKRCVFTTIRNCGSDSDWDCRIDECVYPKDPDVDLMTGLRRRPACAPGEVNYGLYCKTAAVNYYTSDTLYTLYNPETQSLGSGELYTALTVSNINDFCPVELLSYKIYVPDDCCCTLYVCLVQAYRLQSRGWICARRGRNPGCPANANCNAVNLGLVAPGTAAPPSYQSFSQVQGRPLSAYQCNYPNYYCGGTLANGQGYKCVCCQSFVQQDSCIWGVALS